MGWDKSKTCCFTGHRTEKIYDGRGLESIAVRRVLSVLRLAIDEAIDEGYTTFMTGMARGIDLWAARFIVELKAQNPEIKLVCVLPYCNHGKGFRSQDKWDHMLALSVADAVVHIDRKSKRSSLRLRNHFMVDNSSKVIAVVADRRSGTGQTIRYAQKHSSRVRIIDLVENAPLFCAYT